MADTTIRKDSIATALPTTPRVFTSRNAASLVSAGCLPPVIVYEDLIGKTQHERLIYMRTQYNARIATCHGSVNPADADARAGFDQAVANINDALIDIDDGITTTKTELFTSFYGPTRDELDPRTRRSQPFGTVITELDTYVDNIPVATSPDKSTFECNVPDDIPDPSFDNIVYIPSTVTPGVDAKGFTRPFIDFDDDSNKDTYSEDHETCLQDLPCTFKEPIIKVPEKPVIDELTDVDIEDVVVEDREDLKLDIDITIDDKDITSGCANGTGLFDKLMTAIDSSIDLQFKSSRLNNKSFGEFYASTISAAMQNTTQFLVQEKQLLLDKARLDIAIAEYNLKKDNSDIDNAIKRAESKYNVALAKQKALLAKAQTRESQFKALLTQAQVVQTDVAIEQALFEIEDRRKKIPLELSILTQETKGAEKKVELTTRQIEEVEGSIVSLYNSIGEGNATGRYQREKIKVDTDKIVKDISETTANGVLNRNLTEAKVEATRVGIKTAKFDALLKKYQAYGTKVATEESKATGASNRRLTNADIQSKNKQASLYDQQRKTYIYGQRTEVLNIMKDMWNTQIDTLGPEGMAVEAIKGPELSSRLERAALDVGA